jgi:DNA-3-methyladenine glycosylase
VTGAAHTLLGATLVRDDATGRRTARIVEVEAYGGPEDRASHARFGPTARNRVMFGPPGVAYVYLVYGMYDCLNVVSGPEGTAAAVLIRAVEPLEGVARMRADRETRLLARPRIAADPAAAERALARLRATDTARLAAGPGLVAAAFGLDRGWTGRDLCDHTSPLRLEEGEAIRPDEIVAGPRIGVGYAGPDWSDRPWRFHVAGHPSRSGRG